MTISDKTILTECTVCLQNLLLHYREEEKKIPKTGDPLLDTWAALANPYDPRRVFKTSAEIQLREIIDKHQCYQLYYEVEVLKRSYVAQL